MLLNLQSPRLFRRLNPLTAKYWDVDIFPQNFCLLFAESFGKQEISLREIRESLFSIQYELLKYFTHVLRIGIRVDANLQIQQAKFHFLFTVPSQFDPHKRCELFTSITLAIFRKVCVIHPDIGHTKRCANWRVLRIFFSLRSSTMSFSV